jgi:hypothetical protein
VWQATDLQTAARAKIGRRQATDLQGGGVAGRGVEPPFAGWFLASRSAGRRVLRLTHELGLTVRQVREATGVGKAVCEYVRRAKVVGITWPIPPEIDDAELERLLLDLPHRHSHPGHRLPLLFSTGTADLLIRMSTGVLSKRSSETVRNHRNDVRDPSE